VVLTIQAFAQHSLRIQQHYEMPATLCDMSRQTEEVTTTFNGSCMYLVSTDKAVGLRRKRRDWCRDLASEENQGYRLLGGRNRMDAR
jgi:hypothetical protein